MTKIKFWSCKALHKSGYFKIERDANTLLGGHKMEGEYLNRSSRSCSDFKPSYTARIRTSETQSQGAVSAAPDSSIPSVQKPYLHPAGRVMMRVLLMFQRLDTMSIIDLITGKESETRIEIEANEKRPIKFVEEKPNMWRIVYAD